MSLTVNYVIGTEMSKCIANELKIITITTISDIALFWLGIPGVIWLQVPLVTYQLALSHLVAIECCRQWE